MSSMSYAADSVIKEETTPPTAEVGLTPDQLPPILTAIKQAPVGPQPTTQTDGTVQQQKQ